MNRAQQVRANIERADEKIHQLELKYENLRDWNSAGRGTEGSRKEQEQTLARIEKVKSERDELTQQSRQLVVDYAKEQTLETGDGPAAAPHYVKHGDPFAVPDRVTQSTPSSELRSAAIAGIEKWNADDALKQSATQLVEKTDEPRGVGEHVLRTSNPDYVSAFQKFIQDPEGFRDILTSEERGAWAAVRQMSQRAALDLSGAVLPSPLDPSIVLTNAGVVDSFRSAARVEQTTSNTKRFITSAGVTASFDDELVEVSDDTPTLSEVTITTRKAQAFVQASIEAAADQPDFSVEVARLIGDAKGRLEAVNWITGTAAQFEPIGIEGKLDGGASEVAPATAEMFAAADVYALIEDLSPRWRPNASWMAELSTLNQIDQFETGNGAKLFPQIGGSNPSILRRPVIENSSVDAFSAVNVAATADNFILYVGDFQQYIVLDRIGLSIEYVPHLFNTANNLPDGRRGFYAHWRVGGDLLSVDALRVLNLATTA